MSDHTRNTLGLGGDGDEVDLIDAVIEAFDIECEIHELERLENVGQLCDLVLEKLPRSTHAGNGCLTAAAFYRLKKAFGVANPGRRLSPKIRVDELMSYSKSWHCRDEFEGETGLKLPYNEVGGIWLLAAIVLAVFLYFWITSQVSTPNGFGILFSFVSVFALAWVSRLLSARFPLQFETVGDIARATVPINFGKLAREQNTIRESDVWDALMAILDFHADEVGPFDRETVFF